MPPSEAQIFAQPFANFAVADADDAVVLLIARCGSGAAGFEHGGEHFGGNGFFGEAADGAVGKRGFQHGQAV